MTKALEDFDNSITYSAMYESQCMPAKPGPSPGPTPGPSPTGGFELVVSNGKAVVGECLTLQGLEKHALVVIGSCDAGSRWEETSQGWLVNLADDKMCLKLDAMDHKQPCVAGNTIWMGECEKHNSFKIDT